MMNMMMNNNSSREEIVSSARVSALTKQDIAAAARTLQWTRRMPKWTVIVEGRELPARPLVLEAARVPPNDSTNSHQAVAILQGRGFDVRYQGKPVGAQQTRVAPVSEEYISGLRGFCRGEDSLVEALIRDRQAEK
jgi:hypothetical protein